MNSFASFHVTKFLRCYNRKYFTNLIDADGAFSAAALIIIISACMRSFIEEQIIISYYRTQYSANLSTLCYDIAFNVMAAKTKNRWIFYEETWKLELYVTTKLRKHLRAISFSDLGFCVQSKTMCMLIKQSETMARAEQSRNRHLWTET